MDKQAKKKCFPSVTEPATKKATSTIKKNSLGKRMKLEADGNTDGSEET